MKKAASLLLTAILFAAVLALPANAAGVRIAIEPDQDQNIILNSGGYSIVSDYNIGRLEISSGTVFIDRDAAVVVTGAVVVAEGAAIDIEGTLTIAETATVQNDGEINLVCCGTLMDTAHKVQNLGFIHRFAQGEKCLYCSATCLHDNQFTFCMDCGTVIHSANPSQGLSYFLLDGEAAGRIEPAAKPQESGSIRVDGSETGGLGTSSMGVGFVLSEGSLTVIVGMACLAVGFLAAMLLFRKKKPAAAKE